MHRTRYKRAGRGFSQCLTVIYYNCAFRRMVRATRRKSVLFFLLLAVVQRASGQGSIGSELPCEADGENPDPDNLDNFSCPIPNQAILECYSRAQVCDGMNFCEGGADEGITTASLECNSVNRTASMFVCTPDVQSITIDGLCDGIRNCDNGDDETSTLCENKCLAPYYGGCSYSRRCITSEFDVNCGGCLPGFVNDPSNPGSNCLVEIGFERTTYTGSEADEITEEICAVIIADPAEFVGGSLQGTFDRIGLTNITGVITPQQTTGPNAATENSDYNAQPLTVTLSATQLMDCVQVVLFNDGDLETDEEFMLTLTASTGATVTPGLDSAQVNITDDEQEVTAVYRQLSYTVDEDAPSGVVEACVAIVSATAGNLSSMSTVTVTFANGPDPTATVSQDYTPVASPSDLTFSAGARVTNNATTSSSQCFTVPIINDDDDEESENFVLGLGSPTGLIVVDTGRFDSQAVVTINDDDIEVTAVFQRQIYPVDEDDPSGQVTACVAIVSVTPGTLSVASTVTITFEDGPAPSATANEDYTPIASRDLTFASGSTITDSANTSTVICFDVRIIDDDAVEENGPEQFTLGLASPTGLIVVDSNRDDSEATVSITDDDVEGTIGFVGVTFESAEDTTVEVCVELQETTNGRPLNVDGVFTIVTTGDSATDGVDYGIVSVTLTFTMGSMVGDTACVDIALESDNRVEGDESFFLELESTSQFLVVDPNTQRATITITDETSAEFVLDASTYSVSEGDGSVSVSVQLLNGVVIDTSIEVIVITSDQTATAPNDYTGVDEVVTFSAGNQGPMSVRVPIIDDTDVEADETINVGISIEDGFSSLASVGTPNRALITIEDNDAIVFNVSLQMDSVPESAGSATVIISPSSAVPEAVTLTIQTMGGSATGNMDYVSINQLDLQFTVGEMRTLEQEIQIEDDNLVEGDESFFVVVSSANARVMIAGSPATVTIEDNDVIRFGFTQSSYSVSEDAGPLLAEVELAADSGIPTSAFTVSVSTDAGTATDNEDYTGFADSSVEFPQFSTPGTNITIQVSILDDIVVELRESFSLSVTSDDPNAEPAQSLSRAECFIDDNDEAEFALDASTYSVSEGDGSVSVSVQLSNGVVIGTDIEVRVRTSAVTAAPNDYTEVDEVVTFSAGNQGPMSVRVPIIDDTDVEADETLTVSISIEAGFSNLASTADPRQATITIEDNDAIVFDVSLQADSVSESAGSATVIISPRSAVPEAVTLTIQTGEVSATGDMDYVSISPFNLDFTVGQTERHEQAITILDDRLVEEDESFQVIVQLSSANSRVMIVGSPATVTIEDDDVIRFGFTAPTYRASEDDGVLVASVQLEADSGIPLMPFTVSVSTVDTSATDGPDFTGLTDFPVALSDPGTPVSIMIPIIDDSEVEPTESFILTVTSEDPDAEPVLSSANCFIEDNDRPIVGFNPIFYRYDEEEDGGILTVFIELISIGTHPNEIVVLLSTANGSAQAPMDYVPVTDLELTFPANSVMGSTVSAEIVINNDIVLETNGEMFFVDITSSDADIEIGRERATIQLNETNDDIVYRFELTDYPVSEGDIQEVCLIKETAGILSEPIAIVLRDVVMGSSATADADFLQVRTVLTFVPSDTRECINVTILDDQIVEPTEVINLQAILSTSIAGVSIGNGGMASVTITDEDVVSVRLVLQQGGVNVDVPENGGPASICTEVASGILADGQSATVTLSTSDGGAEQPGDYTMQDIELEFNADNMDMLLCVDIPIQDDLICEGPEIFMASLSSSDPNALIASPSQVTVTILDNDVAEITLNVVEPAMFQGVLQECADDGLWFRLDFANNVRKGENQQCVISVMTEDGSAVAGSDYFELDEACTFTDTNTFCEFHIDVLDDFTAEMDEYFNILLTSNDQSRCTVDDNNITISILDDEDCDDDVCGEFEICEELMCPNNFTCIPEGVGDDPHFAVTLSSGKTLCYTVQGEHGFAFNLISNEKLYMNAMFVPDALREEVTWLGTMGIVVNNNGYKKSNTTKLRFEAIKNTIHIDNQMILEARNIEKITLENGKLIISEAPPTEGYKTPFVRIELKDVELSFSIKFMTEHLDLYWHSTGQKTADSHGLIGQFFHHDVAVDEVRKMLILPGKEPVPIQRKPLWAFMEREVGDSTNFCWVAMNPGYQGEGLIDGSYFDYLVDDVLSTQFKFKKL